MGYISAEHCRDNWLLAVNRNCPGAATGAVEACRLGGTVAGRLGGTVAYRLGQWPADWDSNRQTRTVPGRLGGTRANRLGQCPADWEGQ